MAQTSYNYSTPKGVPGGLFDISPYAIDTRLNAEEVAGAIKFGMGVVRGDDPGKNIALPTENSESSDFEGIVMASFTQQHDLDGNVTIYHKQTLGVLRYGKAWVRVDPDAEIEYGNSVYLITEGDLAGFFTNDENELTIPARFVDTDATSGVAVVELFNAPAAV